MKSIYLDHAAATPLDANVFKAMQPYFTEYFYNPSASYAAATNVRRAIDAARTRVAAVLGCRPAELVFTAGGTEANNLAVQGSMDVLQRIDPDARIVFSAIEHDSISVSSRKYRHTELAVDLTGIIDVATLGQIIDDHVGMVSVMYANNEIGTIQPISHVAKIIETIKRDRRRRNIALPLVLHCDAAQAGNYLDLHVSRLGVNLMTLNGGKIYGPKQSGVLYIKGGIELEPHIVGGGQERGLRSGTENVPAIIGFATALEISQAMRAAETRRLQTLQQLWLSELPKAVPNSVVNGSLKKRLPNNIHVTFPNHDNERLLYQLDAAGIMAAAGSACSASYIESSHVLRAIGLTDDHARASLRFTMGRATTEDDIKSVLNTLAIIVQSG